jgi:tellurite methyltransferase
MADKFWIQKQKKRKKYYQATRDRKPFSLLLRVLDMRKFKTALELGCGAGVDAKEMARRGIQVTAVDINQEIESYLKGIPNINVVISSFQDFEFGRYDLIYSKASLPFLPRKDYFDILEKIKNALNPDGIFAARVWGDKDSANNPEHKGKRTFVTPEEIKEALQGLEIVEFNEGEVDGKSALGRPRHWHKIDFIARKPK